MGFLIVFIWSILIYLDEMPQEILTFNWDIFFWIQITADAGKWIITKVAKNALATR